MRRLLIWLGIFGLTVWVVMRILRALDEPPVSMPFRPDPSPPNGHTPSATLDPQPAEQPTPLAEPLVAPEQPQPSVSEISAYCARCRERRVLLNVHEETTATGRRAARGACSVCGTTVFTFLAVKPATATD